MNLNTLYLNNVNYYNYVSNLLDFVAVIFFNVVYKRHINSNIMIFESVLKTIIFRCNDVLNWDVKEKLYYAVALAISQIHVNNLWHTRVMCVINRCRLLNSGDFAENVR